MLMQSRAVTGNGMTVMRTWMTWCALVGAVVCGAGIGSGTVARAEGTAPVEGVVELRVFPTAVNLLTNRDRQLIVVQAVYSDGLTRDVAGQSQWTLANAALVKRDGNTLYAMADGATELKIEVMMPRQCTTAKPRIGPEPKISNAIPAIKVSRRSTGRP